MIDGIIIINNINIMFLTHLPDIINNAK